MAYWQVLDQNLPKLRQLSENAKSFQLLLNFNKFGLQTDGKYGGFTIKFPFAICKNFMCLRKTEMRFLL